MDKNQRKEEFNRHKKRIEDEYVKSYEALYRLYPEFSSYGSSVDKVAKMGRGIAPKIITKAMASHPESFTLDNMAEWIKEVDPVSSAGISRVDISNTLWRLTKRGKIEKIGSNPATYRKYKKDLSEDKKG